MTHPLRHWSWLLFTQFKTLCCARIVLL